MSCGVTLDPQYFTGLDMFQTHAGNATCLVYPQGMDADALQASFVVVLRAYPVFAGRIRRDAQGHDFMDCNDAGVLWRVQCHPGATPPYGLSRPIGPDTQRYSRRIMPWQVVNQPRAAVVLEIHQFEDGGTILTVVASHSVCDGAAFWHFMMDWVRVHRGHPIASPPALDRNAVIRFSHGHAGRPVAGPLLRDTTLPQRLSTWSRLAWQYATAMDWTVFRIPGEQIARWKAETKSADGQAPALATQDLVLAKCLQRLSPRLRPSLPRHVGLVHDLRFRRHVGMGRKYVGNALSRDMITLSAEAIAQNDVASLARQCQVPLDHLSQEELIQDLQRMEYHRHHRTIHTLASTAGWHTADAGLILNNSAHFPVYKVDFGNGPPSWHEYPRAPYRRLLLTPSAQMDGGLDVHLSAHRHELVDFQAWQTHW